MILSSILQYTDSDISATFRGLRREKRIPLALVCIHMCAHAYLNVRLCSRNRWIFALQGNLEENAVLLCSRTFMNDHTVWNKIFPVKYITSFGIDLKLSINQCVDGQK